MTLVSRVDSPVQAFTRPASLSLSCYAPILYSPLNERNKTDPQPQKNLPPKTILEFEFYEIISKVWNPCQGIQFLSLKELENKIEKQRLNIVKKSGTDKFCR